MKLIDIKNYIARQRNTNDGATPDATRDGLINEALRVIYNYRQWSTLTKMATLTITGSEVAFPTDYNTNFEPIEIWNYTDTYKNSFTQVRLEDLEQYSVDDNVFALDIENSKILFKTDETSVFMTYTHLPSDYALDASDDQDNILLPSIEPANYLSLSMFWMSQERATGKQQLYYDLYKESVEKMAMRDKRVGRSKLINHPLKNIDCGFNVN